MKKILLFFPFLFVTVSFAQKQDSITLKSFSDEIMLRGNCYEDLRVLTKTIGHRLSGTEAAAKAVTWAKKTLENAGADSVWLQPALVPKWVRGTESLKISFNGNDFENIPLLSLGNTEGTGGKALNAQIVRVPDLEAFAEMTEMQVKGKIIFFDYHFRQDIINTFEGYGDAVIYRWKAVNEATRKNAAAVIIRSVSTGPDDQPHAGSSHYDDGVQHIPAVAIGNLSADRLAEICRNKQPNATLISNCKFEQPVLSYNVIAEYRGMEKPNEYMVVGGHLDSWDVGEGAHDDGAGIVQSIEVLRTFSRMKIPLKHTLRIVCFMNEENGMKGGLAYNDSAMSHNEKHIFALESDAGGFSPRGFGLEMKDSLKLVVKSWKNLFLPYGVYDFEQEDSGVDISPLVKRGIPGAGLLPDSQRYFDLHHSDNDVFEAISQRELKLGAFAMTALIYLVDQNFQSIKPINN